MTDQIGLKGISAGPHGVLDHETRAGQTFVVDVTMHLDLAPAGASDDLGDTVDYGAVAGDVVALIEGDPLELIETLAPHRRPRAGPAPRRGGRGHRAQAGGPDQ